MINRYYELPTVRILAKNDILRLNEIKGKLVGLYINIIDIVEVNHNPYDGDKDIPHGSSTHGLSPFW